MLALVVAASTADAVVARAEAPAASADTWRAGIVIVSGTVRAVDHSPVPVGTVNNVADKPVAVDDSLSTAFGTAKVLAVLGNDTDADGDLLTVKRRTDATHGTVVCTVGGSCTYAPAAGYSGPDSFDYTVNDGQRGTDVGTVSVSVAPTVAPQVAVAVSVVTSLFVQAIQLVVGPGRQV